jgi:uncharacterized low-complexity protein
LSGFIKTPTVTANKINNNNKQKFKIMENSKKNIFRGVLVAGAIITGSAFSVNASSALTFDELGSGSEIRAKLLNNTDFAFNTFEAKCGEETKEATKAKTTKTSTEAKTKEAKCGEGKCGEADKTKNDSTKKANAVKAKAESKTKEAKCGEGKCGEA